MVVSVICHNWAIRHLVQSTDSCSNTVVLQQKIGFL